MKTTKFRMAAVAGQSLGLMLISSWCIGATINVPADRPNIQAGIDAASNGDIVLVAPGSYRERIDFHGKAVALKSQQGPHVTTIDGQSGGTVITMQSAEGPGTLVQGFTITGGSASFGAGAYLQGAAPTFRGNIFFGNAQGGGGFGAAIAGFSGSPTIDGNEFVGNTCDNQFLSGVLSFVNDSSPQIYNNLIHDNDCRAINMTIPTGPAPLVFNNTIVRNRTGIYIDQRVSNAHHSYRNNLIAQNGIGLEVAFPFGPFDAIWTNNILFGNTMGVVGTTDPTGKHGNLNVDPHFVNAAFDDFHLALGSPALDAGTATGLILSSTDFDGAPRVQDANGDGVAVVDIGALEAGAVPSAPVPVPIDSRTALLVLAATIFVIAKLRITASGSRAVSVSPNPSVNRTAEKLRFSVPRRLRRRAAGYLEL